MPSHRLGACFVILKTSLRTSSWSSSNVCLKEVEWLTLTAVLETRLKMLRAPGFLDFWGSAEVFHVGMDRCPLFPRQDRRSWCRTRPGSPGKSSRAFFLPSPCPELATKGRSACLTCDGREWKRRERKRREGEERGEKCAHTDFFFSILV